MRRGGAGRCPYLVRRQWEEELLVEAARAAQGGVNGVDAIGGANHDHVMRRVQPVHEREQRGHDAGVHDVVAGGPRRRQPVDLVEEDDGRLQDAGLDAQPCIALSATRVAWVCTMVCTMV